MSKVSKVKRRTKKKGLVMTPEHKADEDQRLREHFLKHGDQYDRFSFDHICFTQDPAAIAISPELWKELLKRGHISKKRHRDLELELPYFFDSLLIVDPGMSASPKGFEYLGPPRERNGLGVYDAFTEVRPYLS